MWSISPSSGRPRALSLLPGKVGGRAGVGDPGHPGDRDAGNASHSLAASIARARVGGVGLGVKGFRIQPVDIAFVARRLAEVASEPAPAGFARHVDLTGRTCSRPSRSPGWWPGTRAGRSGGAWTLPALGGTLKAFAAEPSCPAPMSRWAGSASPRGWPGSRRVCPGADLAPPEGRQRLPSIVLPPSQPLGRVNRRGDRPNGRTVGTQRR